LVVALEILVSIPLDARLATAGIDMDESDPALD
jgi:hypothetical protein